MSQPIVAAVVEKKRIVGIFREPLFSVVWRDGASSLAMAGLTRSSIPAKGLLLE
jgi:hypothetical protein